MQTSYRSIFQKSTSVAAIYITLGVPGRRADKKLHQSQTAKQRGRIFSSTTPFFLESKARRAGHLIADAPTTDSLLVQILEPKNIVPNIRTPAPDRAAPCRGGFLFLAFLFFFCLGAMFALGDGTGFRKSDLALPTNANFDDRRLSRSSVLWLIDGNIFSDPSCELLLSVVPR
jgi:hypothetical protein